MLYICNCGEIIAKKRVELGFRTCLPCGEKVARERKHTIVPLHKSAYQPITDPNMLKMLNKYAQTN